MPRRRSRAAASAYWSVTNTLNLARIASRGALGAIAMYGANYEPDESIDFGGLLVLRDRKSIGLAVVGRHVDIGVAILELRTGSVPSDLEADWGTGPSGVTLVDGALPIGAVQCVHFPSEDAREDHMSMRFGNVDWNVFLSKVSPELFEAAPSGRVGDAAAADGDEECVADAKLPLPSPESRLAREDVEAVDRLVGAFVTLLTTVPHDEERVAEVDELLALALASCAAPSAVAESCIAYVAAVTETDVDRLARACEVLLSRPNDDRELLGPLGEFLDGDSAPAAVADQAVRIARALDDLSGVEALGDRLVWALLMALTTDAGPSLSERLRTESDAPAGLLAAWLLGYRLGATQRLLKHRIEELEPTVGRLTARLLNGALAVATPSFDPRPQLVLSVDGAESVVRLSGDQLVELSRQRTKSFNDEAIDRAVGETAVFFAESLGVPIKSVIEVSSKTGTELRTVGNRTTVAFDGRVDVLLKTDESAVHTAIRVAEPTYISKLLAALDVQAQTKG